MRKGIRKEYRKEYRKECRKRIQKGNTEKGNTVIPQTTKREYRGEYRKGICAEGQLTEREYIEGNTESLQIVTRLTKVESFSDISSPVR